MKIAIALGLVLGAALSLAGPSAEALRKEPGPAYGGGTIVFSCGGCPRAGGKDFQGHHFVIAPVNGARPRRVAIPELPHETYSELHGLDWR